MCTTNCALIYFIVIALNFLCFHQNCVTDGVRLTRMDVPSTIIVDEAVWLNCSFDLENDKLYSIKWYKNSTEFYRFIPSDEPMAKIYISPGLEHIDLSKSSKGNVYLSRTNLKTEGIFRCEVSADSPSFQTVRQEKEMKVYYFPSEGPTIFGLKPNYEIGEQVNITCVAKASKPPTTLKFYINEDEVESDLLTQRSYFDKENNTETQLSLLFRINSGHFVNKMLKLKCTALISEAYSKSSEEVIVDHIKTPSFHTTHDEEGPLITGAKLSYNVGDLVNITCVSSKSKPASELKWFINDVEAPIDLLLFYPRINFHDGNEIVRLGLQFRVTADHFENVHLANSDANASRLKIRLKCTASLSKVINIGSKETIIGSGQQSSELHVSERNMAVNKCTDQRYPHLYASLLFLCIFHTASLLKKGIQSLINTVKAIGN